MAEGAGMELSSFNGMRIYEKRCDVNQERCLCKQFLVCQRVRFKLNCRERFRIVEWIISAIRRNRADVEACWGISHTKVTSQTKSHRFDRNWVLARSRFPEIRCTCRLTRRSMQSTVWMRLHEQVLLLIKYPGAQTIFLEHSQSQEVALKKNLFWHWRPLGVGWGEMKLQFLLLNKKLKFVSASSI